MTDNANPNNFPARIEINWGTIQLRLDLTGEPNGTAHYTNGMVSTVLHPHDVEDGKLTTENPKLAHNETGDMPETLPVIINGKARELRLLVETGVPHRRDVNLNMGVYRLETKKRIITLPVTSNKKGYLFGVVDETLKEKE